MLLSSRPNADALHESSQYFGLAPVHYSPSTYTSAALKEDSQINHIGIIRDAARIVSLYELTHSHSHALVEESRSNKGPLLLSRDG